MSTIMEIKSVLNQKTLDVFCCKSHIPECVHPELPNLNQTIYEAPAGKIGVYTRFFKFANFCLPLSAFLVEILRIEPTVGLFRCFYVNSKSGGWMSFSKRSNNAPVFMDLFAFIHVVNLTKVKVGERERFDNEAPLLEFTARRIVPLLPVALACSEGELTASVDKLFEEGESAEKGDSAKGGDQGAEIEPTTYDAEVVVSKKPKGRRLKRQAIGDAIEPNHPPKKLREDHDVISGATTGGKSAASLQSLLDSSRLPAEIGVVAVPTISFVTSSVTLSPEREGGDHMDSIIGPNLRTTGASGRFVILSDSSHHSSTNASQAEVNSLNRSSAPPVVIVAVVVFVPTPKTVAKVVPQTHPSLFHDSASTGMVGPNIAGTSQLVKKEPSVDSGELNAESQNFLPQWIIRSDFLLDNNTVSHKFIDYLAPPALFAQIRNMDYEQLFTKFNVRTARQACLSTKLMIRTEYGLGERTRLEAEFDKKVNSLKAKDDEIESLKAQLLLKGAEAAEALQRKHCPGEGEAIIAGKVTKLQSLASDKEHKLADSNNAIASFQSEKSGLVNQDAQAKVLDDRVTKLNDDFVETCLHLEEKFYPHLLTTISDRRWLLTHVMKLAIVKCLNSPKYLTTLEGAISRAIEKGMLDGLAAGIDHGKAGRSLGDVVAFNPSAEADFTSTLQQFRNVDFSLLVELSSHKDASIEAVINILHLEGPFADATGMTDLQPDVDQLMVPIHRLEDQVVLGSTSLSFALSVSDTRVKKIRENIAEQRSALLGVFVEPLSAEFLTGGVSHSLSDAIATTTALSTTFASTSLISPLLVDDYEAIGTDGQGMSHGDIASVIAVDFKREDLKDTPERAFAN
ncbi:hypothetical protein Tco_0179777 [Tanacetum coccineum]